MSYPEHDPYAAEVRAERIRQDAKWGEQNHPDGTGGDIYRHMADSQRQLTDLTAKVRTLTWSSVLASEFREALAESDPAKLRAELIRVEAVARAWREAIDRRTAASTKEAAS